MSHHDSDEKVNKEGNRVSPTPHSMVSPAPGEHDTNLQHDHDHKSSKNTQLDNPHMGTTHWEQQRAKWCVNNSNTTSYAKISFMDGQDELEDDVVDCLQSGYEFPERIPLPALVQLLNELWQEDFDV